jgi:hypothetical protein
MELKKTGGQAFPISDGQAAHAIAAAAISGIEDVAERDRVYTEVRGQAMQGMTLRDYFAAKAMQGMLSDLPKSMYGMEWESDVAEAAYRIADRLIAERAK